MIVHSVLAVRAVIEARCASRGYDDAQARYECASIILAYVLQCSPDAAAIFDTDWRATDALVARSDANALDALTRALDR